MIDSSSLDRHNYSGESPHKDDYKDEFLNIIDRMIFQKWYTEITLVVHKEFWLTVIALVDSGADMNCIQEGLIPFFLTDKLSSKVILGNPFLALLYPFFMTENGICTNILETEVFFKFLLPPFPKDIHLLKEISISKDISTDKIELVIDDKIPTYSMMKTTFLASSSST